MTICAFVAVATIAFAASVSGEVSFPTRDGGTVHANRFGEGTHVVVLAHGGRFTKESWDEQIPAFVDAGFAVIAIDFRGRGQSRGGPESSTDDVHYDVMAAVRYAKREGAERVSVVGASFGGWAAARAATLLEPGTLDAIVLMAAPGIEHPEKMQGRKLFITTRDDASGGGIKRLPDIRDQHARAPEPKHLVILEGSAHAQFVFETDQGDHMLAEILAFLRGQSPLSSNSPPR